MVNPTTRKPRTVWLPLTYGPKIPGVLSGDIGQTIRVGWMKYQIGDRIAYHGWSGVPYRSKWSFRTEYFTLHTAIPIWMCRTGFELPAFDCPAGFYPWEHPVMDTLARLDGIEPATGVELGNVLNRYHKLTDTAIPGQIIRW